LLEHALAEQRALVDAQVTGLRDAARWSTLGKLTTELGHEIRNSLGSATLFLRAARERVPDDAEAAPFLARADEALEQLTGVVTSVRRYAGPAEPAGATHLRDVLEDAVKLSLPRIRSAGAEIELSVDPDLRALGRHGELVQVFVNLIVNACESVVNAKDKRIAIGAERAAGRIRLRVEDGGARPTREIARQMFTPLFTTKAADGGSGLGLSVSRRLVQGLGGALTFEAAAPRTTFVVDVLPSDAVSPPRTSTAGARGTSRPPST
jgi:C4-dicarboxylate-specific signal transduction histidine kinase